MGQEHWGTRGGPYGPRADVNVPSQSVLSIHCELGVGHSGGIYTTEANNSYRAGLWLPDPCGSSCFPSDQAVSLQSLPEQK